MGPEILERGFYLVRREDGNVKLVLTRPRDNGGVVLVDEYGGVYSIDDVLTEEFNKGPLPVDLVKSLISIDRQRVQFVDEGLAGLAALK
jgi:hypothetical protein